MEIAEQRTVGVVVPAAGLGRRMGGAGKPWLELGGRPLLERTLRPLLSYAPTRAIVVALAPPAFAEPPEWLDRLDSRVRLVQGGATRFESVLAALEALPEELDVTVVHDAARPLVTREIVERCVQEVQDGRGAVAGWPVVDTLKIVDPLLLVRETPDRSRFWRAQTPQAFPRAELLEAYRAAKGRPGPPATDDADVYSRSGGAVTMIEGSPWNLKVTHSEDLHVAESILRLRADSGEER